jgi:hypothetical protein
MSKLETAVARLERAIARLETAAGRLGESQKAQRAKTGVSADDFAALSTMTETVAARLDAAIGRLDRVLEG